MDGDTPFLPKSDFITNILKRLPVKSLIRFQCVCKHWKNFFKIPSFIADHLHHSTHQNPFLLLQPYGTSRLHLLDREMQVLRVQNAPSISSSFCVRAILSSNGLLCDQIASDYGASTWSLLLWNPAIREVRHVSFNDFEGDCRLGFGFSPIVNDYKIVRTYAQYGGEINRVGVYSLSTGSWREIEIGNLEGVKLCSDEAVAANGAIFWGGLRLDEDNMHWIIVSFDIAMEVFTLMPWPPVDSTPYAQFTVYDNKLALLCHGDSESSMVDLCVVDLWVMEEGNGASGERWSWTKKYSSRPHPCLLHPVTIWRNEIVCKIEHGKAELIRECEAGNDASRTDLSPSNLATNKFKILTIPGCSHVHFLNYVESLVPVVNSHNEEP